MNRDNGGVAGGANLPALRSHNAALVLDLLRTAGEGGISRLELAERTGLTPQAVSKITARLRVEGLAAEAGRRASTGGKPATVLRLVPAAAHAIGLHLDRDELTAVLLDLAGTRVAAHRVPLDLGAGADAVLAVVAEEVAALTALTTLTTGRGASNGAYPAPASPRASTSAPASASDAAPASIAAASPASVAASAATSEAAPASVSVSASAPISAVGPASASAPAVGPTSASAPAADSASASASAPAAASASAPAAASASAPAADPASASAYAPVPGAVLGVGVAMPGPLDHRTGTPGRVTGFPEWDGFPLREELARRLGLPVVLDKDTNAAALGLALRPDAPDSFAYVHLGTGLGAGLVLGGAVLRGGRTGAGELGHQTVQLDGPPCDCGGRGCLEVLCLTALAHGDRAEAARILGTGAANLVRLLDIDRVLLGGRAVLADPEAYARGAREVLAGLGLSADVGVAVAPYAVTEGAAQLILAPIFGK
ncbi:ROK family protein [Streptomyces sp. NPDC058084]|uniref:ROK family transcriptional regulator n=1 Tax=Streptomyces sp. NPDC058084 TaxID=3346333 RepID=UPI0036EAC3B0